MKAFTLDTTIGDLIQEMLEEGQGLSLQEVEFRHPAYPWETVSPSTITNFSILIGKGPEVSDLMHRLMAVVREATGAEGERIDFRIG